ncbi:molybdopterin-dependent oxidoreductase [Streptomyces sp. NPDC017964]|uniref:molybdopterin-dependent oxidoreductase n=1 Tax=Streptomyces sp. NPDC017964 TaxID=3365022 RepID=UPI0037AF9505
MSLGDLRKLPAHEQITQHFCIQGWSGVAKWGGVSMATILDLVNLDPYARWVVFYSLGEGADGGTYYDAHPIEHMRSKLAMLAYDMNDEPLSFGHGAPLRLRNELELAFKQGQMDEGDRVRRRLLRHRQRLWRIQPGPRSLRLPAVPVTSGHTVGT